MVALKRELLKLKIRDVDRSRNAVVALKQYVEGVIEESDLIEAGTPWWH